MSFDRLAPHYRWMELVLAGNKLQRCRTAFLDQAADPQRVLIMGEGNGRFLLECRRRLKRARITCVDSSRRMLDLAQVRLQRHRLSVARIDFVHADALEWRPPPGTFDTIVTHFFLDCFRPDQLQPLVANLSRAAKPNAAWLLADFCMPASGFRRVRAGLIHKSMYLFFRVTCHLAARALSPPDSVLQEHGFTLQDRLTSEWGLLHSDRWERKKG
jgi:ubiquinone/menaquinone biosynthesis C-methylase UbiE